MTKAMTHGKLAHRARAASSEVDIHSVLNDPSRRLKFGINITAGFLFRGLSHVLGNHLHSYCRVGGGIKGRSLLFLNSGHVRLCSSINAAVVLTDRLSYSADAASFL